MNFPNASATFRQPFEVLLSISVLEVADGPKCRYRIDHFPVRAAMCPENILILFRVSGVRSVGKQMSW